MTLAPRITLTEQIAVRQAVNFALDPSDAFRVYDVAGMVARRDGRLGDVGPWTFLLAGAIGGGQHSGISTAAWSIWSASRSSLGRSPRTQTFTN